MEEVILQIKSGRYDISFEKIHEDPISLGQTYVITNNGNTISDFSLVPDSSLAGNMDIIPSIKRYRFQPEEKITVRLEPRLYIGFAGLKGKLNCQGGGAPEPVEIPLAFNPPEGQKLFLGVARCGSMHSTHISEIARTKIHDANDPYQTNGLSPC